MDETARKRFYARLTRPALARLLRIAESVCWTYNRHFVRTKSEIPSRSYESRELLDETVARISKGQRSWDESVEFFAFMRKVMESIASEAYRRASPSWRTTTWSLERMELVIDAMMAADRELDLSDQFVDRVREVLREDADALEYLDCWMMGTSKRAEMAARLGWSFAKLVRVRARVVTAARALAHGFRSESRESFVLASSTLDQR